MKSRVFKFFSSLKLTVFCLGAALILVFIGTLAQVKEGLYQAQERYFQSTFIYWGPVGADWKIPVFPGGYFLGWLLLINLLAAHYQRFSFSKKKIGIFLTHGGLIFLLLGQFTTELFQVESQMRLREGGSKNYSESAREYELVVIDRSDAKEDQVVAFPLAQVAAKGELSHAGFPFKVKVKEYFPNSEPQIRAPMNDTAPAQGDKGIAQRFRMSSAPITAKMDDKNIPSTVVEITGDKGSLGTWLLSGWATEEGLVLALGRNWEKSLSQGMGTRLAEQISQPQEFKVDGKTYQIALRPVRYYKPFSIHLLDFTHEVYKGTDTPKNFSSRIRLQRPETSEDREVLIYMNNPLRYNGETYYQAGFDPLDEHVTILQVVRNPSWLTPYLACVVMGLGMTIQFMSHLIGFAKRRSA